MNKKDILTVVFAPLPVLLIPLWGMHFSTGWKWGPPAFILAWVLMAGAVLAYKLATRGTRHLTYRLGAALAVLAAFVLTWMNLAVGLIGSEDNPANLLYGAVLAIGVIGAIKARFEAHGMAWALFATAVAQLMVPVIALMLWPSDFRPGVAPVFALNGFFALLFAASALLFRHAARKYRVGAEATP